MNAWQILVSNSTLPDNGINNAWEHLNNQQGGGGGGAPYPVYLIHTNMADVSSALEADAANAMTAEITLATEIAVIDPQTLTATVTNTNTAEI